VVIIDNTTHKVIGYIGSGDFKDSADAGQVNGAAAIRQPGSTLKPLLYGLCIDEGFVTPKTMMTDVAVNYQGYAPENYDKKYNGYVTMEYALEHSLNIPAVKSLQTLGKDYFVQKLSACDFVQVQKDQKKLGLSMILGGCGATLEELTGLYSSFANEGVYVQPLYADNTGRYKKLRILSTAATYMINETLSKVNRPDFPLNWQSTEHMPKIAWKTGTSYGRRDAWSIGYNKHYTVGIWVGNFSGMGVADLSGANVATPLLFKIFNTIDYDTDEEWFTQPKDCDLRIVCSETGMIPGEHCTDLVTDYFIPLISSSKKCDNLQEIAVSEDEKISYCKECMPGKGYKKKLYKIIPAEMQLFFDENKISYREIPEHNLSCTKIFRENGPLITSPANGTEYLISKKDPEPLQLSCQAGADVSKVYWYINNKFYRTTAAKSKQFFVPGEGPVKISCTDDKGRNRDIWITVKKVNL
jgi:penicillin-binding protein 1C